MKKFLFLYWGMIFVLFSLFYWELFPIATLLNHLQTDFTSYLSSLMLPNEIMQDNEIIISKTYHLVIEKACNGMVPFLFFLASILAFPSTVQHKILWFIVGYSIITVINALRIWLITQLVLDEVGNFSLAHDIIGNSILILTAILLFITFIKTR